MTMTHLTGVYYLLMTTLKRNVREGGAGAAPRAVGVGGKR